MLKNEHFSLKIEALLGLAISVAVLWFSFYAYKSYNLNTFINSKLLIAKFTSVDGLYVGSEVKIGGVRVGFVDGIFLDENLYPIVTINVDDSLKIPSDSIIAVTSSGLLGGKFLDIHPGMQEEILKNGDSFQSTQSSINVEGLIKKFAVSPK